MKVGCDIVDLRRLQLDNEAFIRGVLSPKEREIFAQRKDKAFPNDIQLTSSQKYGIISQDERSFLGGRFAAKEAFLKALGTGLSGARMNEIDVSYREGGQPILLYQRKEYEVSISHDGDYAIAIVIL